MNLKEIGFYTLSNERAINSSKDSPLYRCEMILTDRCNFSCPYCRGVSKGQQGDMSIDQAIRTINLWLDDGLKNIRFSGGEPTLWEGLVELVKRCKESNVEHIAVSTNGSASLRIYQKLIDAGVNDFSISLDSGCCAIGDKMAGNIQGAWGKVVENIKALSSLTYVTVGVVFTEQNVEQAKETVLFAKALGVSDIRVIPAAQYKAALEGLAGLPEEILREYPILNYRVKNMVKQDTVRGIEPSNRNRCRLVLDDMAVLGDDHYPCIIYLREGGGSIGKIGKEMRTEREQWSLSHEPWSHPICKENCLDVCREYNHVASGGRNVFE